ncbi:hypothetical protein [Ruminiclostridium josui]|uniref:hypothetical protein n=1 Tax=Ruminiclostridium josui TaxID=1499 RepID=UPI000A68BF47|nr:hypothetical protein [Ruminiclostridium josui]
MISDGMFLAILCISAVVSLITIFYIVISTNEIVCRQRYFKGGGFKGLINFVLSLAFMGSIGYCLYNVPEILFLGHHGTVWRR